VKVEESGAMVVEAACHNAVPGSLLGYGQFKEPSTMSQFVTLCLTFYSDAD